MSFTCGGSAAPGGALRVLSQLADCCMGAVTDGPLGCSCWVVEYDREQAPPVEGAPIVDAEVMCADCAFKPGSPERTGSDTVSNASLGDLLALPNFFCHQGARRAVRYRHRLGIVVEVGPDGADYQPPIVERDGERVPLRADGTPLDRCAGWAAHHRDPGRLDRGEPCDDVQWEQVRDAAGITAHEATLWGGLWAEVHPPHADRPDVPHAWKVLRSDDGHQDVVADGLEPDERAAKRAAVRWAIEHRAEHEAVRVGELARELKEQA